MSTLKRVEFRHEFNLQILTDLLLDRNRRKYCCTVDWQLTFLVGRLTKKRSTIIPARIPLLPVHRTATISRCKPNNDGRVIISRYKQIFSRLISNYTQQQLKVAFIATHKLHCTENRLKDNLHPQVALKVNLLPWIILTFNQIRHWDLVSHLPNNIPLHWPRTNKFLVMHSVPLTMSSNLLGWYITSWYRQVIFWAYTV